MFKRSSASWLEDRDFWRFSGIFRDVFLYAAPSAHVRDMKVISDYDGANGIFSATQDIVGKCSVKSILTDENGTIIVESNEKESVNWTIENSKPWSAEIPNLYTFTVILTDEIGNEIEVSKTKVGFRRFELKKGIMCLNGKRIIFKGINRHEFDAKTGRAITKAWFCQYHLTHFIRTRIMQRERYDHSRAFFGLPEADHRWRCRFFC